MSLFQSLTVAVAGMQSQANKLGVVSDNVANVNTVGYKAGVANFSSLVHGFKGGGYLAGGVKPGHQQTNQKGGNVSVTDSVTDLTISGRGFFPVSETSTGTLIRYTRAGSFTTNKAGDYLNSSGYFLKGWRLDDAGNLPTGLDSPTITQSTAEAALQTINVANITIAAIPTTSIALQANLNAGDRVVPNNSVNFIGNVIPTQAALITTGVDINTTLKTSQSPTTVVGYDPIDALHNMTSGVVPADYETTLTVYDAGGKARTLNVSYLKTAANSWAVEVSASPTTSITPTVGNPVGLVASGNLTFNADGTLASASPALTAATNITWLTPSSTNAITFDFGTVGTADGVKEQATPSTTTVNLVSNLNSLQTTTAVVGYNPLDSLHNMASGVVAPHYTTPLTMYDASGTARTVNVSYLKTSTGQWAVEIYAPLASDITPAVGNPAGLIASGNLVFNSSTGALSSISAGLSGAAAVTWNSPASTSTSNFNFGAIGSLSNVKESSNPYTGVASIQPNPVNFASTLVASPDYDGSVTAQSMSGGLVTPHYSRLLALTDNTGTARSVAVNFIKTAPNTWAIELTAQPATDITTAIGGVAGQIARGTATFNANGSLESISSSLSEPIAANWVGTTEANSLQVNWGALNSTTGLNQSGTAFASAPTIVQNYDPTNVLKNMSSGNVAPLFNRTIDVIDNGGTLRTLNFTFLKTNLNTWAVEINTKNQSDVTLPSTQIAHGNVTFNGDGTLASITPSLSGAITVPWSTGGPSIITLDLGTAGPIAGTPNATVIGKTDGLSQFVSSYRVNSASQNGSASGVASSVSIDSEGFLTGKYNNGSSRRLYKIPLAEFISPDRLQSISGNIFAESNNSGDALYSGAGAAAESTIKSGVLESSNVDLPTELSNLLVAQRSYQSNSKLVTTTDDMLSVIFKM